MIVIKHSDSGQSGIYIMLNNCVSESKFQS